MLSGPMTEYHLYAHANNLAFSEKGLVAMSMGNIVEVSLVFNCISVTLQVTISVSYICWNLFVICRSTRIPAVTKLKSHICVTKAMLLLDHCNFVLMKMF